MQVKVLCTGIVSAISYSTWKYSESKTKPNRVLEWYTTWKSQNIAMCAGNDEASNSTINNSSKIKADEKNSKKIEPPKNEMRFILLGTTGSGKSSAGNQLLKNKKGFKTSCFAKSETLESKLGKLTWKKDSQTFQIHIIDTPAYVDTGLTEKEVEHETQKAVDLSAPGPHAFLLCIPAISVTESHEEILKPYGQYFDEVSEFTIVILTRYDQLTPEQKPDIVSKLGLPDKMKKDMIILRNNDKVDKTNELIDIIIRKKMVFASCKQSGTKS